MSSSAVNPPDSPPKDARDVRSGIPEGLATKLGKFGAPLILILGALSDSAGIELDGTSEKAFYASLAMIIVTMVGRYAQGYALYRDAPSPRQASEEPGPEEEPIEDFEVEDFQEEEPAAEAPTEDALREQFVEDAPTDEPRKPI